MMRLLRRFIFLLCLSSSIATSVNVGGDPIHRRNRVGNHHASGSGEQSRHTGSTTRLHKRSKITFVTTSRKKRVARAYETIKTKRQIFPRRPILNTKRQLLPRGPALNARRQLLPKQPVPINIKRQLFPRKPLANTRRQLFPRVPLASSKRQLFSRTPLLGLKRQLFPRRPSPRKFPPRPDVDTNQQVTPKRTFLNAKRQLFPRTPPLLSPKTPLVSRRPIINKKRQLFPRRPLPNVKPRVVPRRPALGSKRQLFPRIPLLRAQSRTLKSKPKYDVSQPSVSHTTTKTHVSIFHNNANSAELHNLHSLQHDEDRFPWKSYAEVKAPSINILSGKKSSVIRSPNKPTAIVVPGPHKGTMLSLSPPLRGRGRQNVPNLRARVSQRKNIAWSRNMQQNQKIPSQKSAATPGRRRFDPKINHQHPSSEHAFPFAIHSRSELPKETSRSIFPNPVVSLKGRTTIPGFHGDRIDSQRNARIAALEHYMDSVSKRYGPAKVVIHTRIPANDHMGLLSVKKSYYKIPERKSEVSVPASKKYFNVNKRTLRYEHLAAKKRSTKEPNFESKYIDKPLSHEIHKLHVEESNPVTTKRLKTHSSNKKQRFLIPKLIPTQITKNQIPNYNEPWKNHANPSGGRAIDSKKVKKSLVKNATVTDLFPDVESIPSTTDSYYHPDTATTIHETTTITQMKSNLLDPDDDPFKGDAVAPSKKETVMTVQLNNDEDTGVVEDNATKKHFTGVINHNNNLSDKSSSGHKVRYRQLGISSDFMDMKTPTHNIVADDDDNRMKQNQDNDIVGKSRLNKYGKKTPDSQLKMININNRNHTFSPSEMGKIPNNTIDTNDISKSVTTIPDNPVNTKLKAVVKQKTSASSDAHDIKTRVDSSEFKNSTEHDVKLVAPSQSNENAKPFYMKEQASKDDTEDDECTPEAQKKEECGNEFSKPPVVNNKNNQLGIAQSHATPAAGEMPPVKSKEVQAPQAAQCACQGKVECACEASPTPAPTPAPCTCEHTTPDCACAVKPPVSPVPEVPETDSNHVTNECTQHPCAPIKPSHEDVDVISIVKPSNVSQVCSDEQDAACHHGKQAETESPSVNPPECATQTTPCTCAPNTPCACNPNCNAFSTSNSGPPTSSPSKTLALSTPVQKPCCMTTEDCPIGQKICEPVKESGGGTAPSARPSATNAAAGCSETCPHELPMCVPCSIANVNPSKGSAAWLPLSPKEPPSRFSSERPDNEVVSDSLNAVSDNSDGGKVNMDAFVEDLPNVKGILASSFSKKKYNFRSCEFLATSNKNGVEVRLHPTPACSQISFSSLIQQLLGGEYDLAGPSDNLIVIGKFDAVGFNIDKIRERISFSLQCKELMDIIPNKLRISSAKVLLNFSYDSLPKSISDFVIKIDGLIHLNYRSRVLNINVDKAIDSTLFMIDMQARDLELPEFTKLFTQTEILQDELPSDLATLVTSSLRNPRISGLYDSGGAFEFVASSKSPPSIFPLQPMVYVIIQKPRLGKVVSGMIVNFERAMYKTLLSSILDKDLSSIPLFKDIRTDLAIGVSTDGLYVIKDALFNKEVGSLFDSGKPIKKGLTFKAKLPIGKMINDGLNNGTASGKNSMGSGNDGVPENVLIDCEVTGNKMHLQFPEGLSLSLMNVGGFFGEEGQDMNFPTVSGELGRNVLSIKNYEVDNIEKKSVTVSFLADTPMKIGSLMTLGNVEANLKRDEYAKWSFVCTGDYQLGDTSVSVSLTSESDGFLISSKPSSIRSLLLVDVLDKSEEILKSELTMYHMDDFVIEDFRISGSLKSSNIIRFAGKPALFGVETSVIEFVATQEETGNDLLAMGLLFENVNLDKVFGRMLDRNLLRRSWAVGTNIGLFVSSSKTATDLRFEMGGLAKTRIQPGNHLRVLLLRPEPTACKGDSLCKVLSAEMPIGSAFLLDGYMVDGTLKLSETIKDPLVLSKSLVLKNVALKMRIKDSVEIYVTGGLTLPNVEQVGFTGELRVDNTGHLQLKMIGNDTWRRPFGLKNVGFFNTTLSAAFEPGFPVPTMDVHGDISIGTDPMDTIKSLLGPVNVKINSGANGRNTFTAKVKDLNFERLAMATGSKRNLLRFQKEAVFLDDAVLTYGPINKNEVTKDATTRDTTPSEPVHDSKDDDEENSNEKSEIKLTGRMRVLGSLSDYTMKFLQDGTQLLAEVQMPDIGVNHGELTIKAGLKRHSVHSDPQSPKGPTLLIRMDPTMNSGIIVGRISALGFSRLSAIKVEDEGFSSMMFGQLPGNHSTNVTLHSAYEPTLEDANFQISACLPVQKPVKEALMNYLQDKAALTKKTLVAGEDRVQKTEDIFKKTSSNIKNYEDVSNLFLQEMRMKGDQLVKLKDELKRRCVPDCGDSCMGLPTWKPSGISLNGKDAIGAPSWSACSRKIPDLSCIVRCLGEKVIGNVRANRKQVELQGLISSLAETKNIIRTNRMYDSRARNLVNSTASGLNKIKNTIQVGSDIANFMTAKDNNIGINNVCFQDSLDNAERSLVNFEATTNINGVEKKMVIPSTLDGNTEYNIAEGIANTIFPGFFDFNKNLEQVKVLFSNLDGERDEIEKLMGKTNEMLEKSNVEVRSEVDWNPEEIEFRKLAFGELPRFTLSDDETMHAFDEQSLWNIAPQNDPLFTKLKEDTIKAENKTAFNAFAKEFASGTPCDQLKRSINHYGDVVGALTDFTKKFLQERNIFRRQKNHRLADLRMIDDQIKSDCFIENCTMEDMDNALSYLGKAKYGLLRWANVMENQIEEQNKVALSYFSKRAGDIVEASQGLSLRRYIVNVKSIATNAVKRTSIPGKDEVENDIKEIGKEMYHLLIGVKNSDELSTASPKIFRLKRQIQALDRSRGLCANVSDETQTSLDSLDEYPSKDGTDYTAKQQVVKENFMNPKFLSHKDIDDDIVSPVVKENDLDDDDDDGTKSDAVNAENSSNSSNEGEINYAIENSDNNNNEANTETKTAPAVPGEQRDLLAKSHEKHKTELHFKAVEVAKEEPSIKNSTENANARSEMHVEGALLNSTSSDLPASQHHTKEDRMLTDFKMINDDVLSFNNDLRLDLPEKHNSA